jgi:hypothetical protein
MPYYKNNKRINLYEVGIYDMTNKLFWTKGKELKTISLENIFKYRSCPAEFNKFEEMELFVRNPLEYQKKLFDNNNSEFVGKAKNEEEVKHLILKKYYRGFYTKKVDK